MRCVIKEIWKDIKDYEGLYQVSNLGRVRSLDKYVKNKNGKRLIIGKVIKQKPHPSIRYNTVSLSKNGKRRPCYVHRLVATEFVKNPKGFNEVDHVNHDTRDNSAKNLEWVSRTENIRRYRKLKMEHQGYISSKRGIISKMNVSGIEIYIGKFNNKEDAIKSFIEAYEEWYGYKPRIKQ